MRFSQLEYLVYLRRYGTFSRAAEALYVSQPAISVAIRELEEELGYPLLIRGRRGVDFTPEGLRALEHAKAILREVEGIQAVGAERARAQGVCVVGGTPHFCTSILVDVKLRLERERPGLRLVFRETGGQGVVDELERGELHMGAVQLCDLEEGPFWQRVEALGLQWSELFTEPLCAAVGAGHPLAGRGTVSFAELAGYPYGTYQGAMNQQIRRLLSAVDDPLVFALDDIAPLRELIIRRNGYTVIPVRALRYGNSLYRSQFVPLEIEDTPLTSRVVLLRGPASLSPLGDAVAQALLPACRRYLEEGAPAAPGC